jgi:cobalt-zinc-cadmium resistance protein CzcA
MASQSIPWPTLLKAQVKALTSAKVLSEKRLKITQNLVASSVKFYYYQILAQQKNLQFLASQDSLYTQMKRAATIKFQQGETNRLELMAAETRLREFQQKRIALEADQKTAYQNLAYWINEPGEFEIEGKESVTMESGATGFDLSKNPTIELLAEQVEHGKLLTAVERERLKPDVRIGVTTQSIENVGGQNFVQAGLAIPIFGKAQKAKIASAKLQEEAFLSQKIQTESALQIPGEFSLLYLHGASSGSIIRKDCPKKLPTRGNRIRRNVAKYAAGMANSGELSTRSQRLQPGDYHTSNDHWK